MYCPRCSHELRPTDKFCPNCASATENFAFDERFAARVEPLDQEEPTVVRSAPKPIENISSRKSLILGGFIGASVLLVLAAIIFGAFSFFHNRRTVDDETSDLNSRANAAGSPQAVTSTPIPPPTPTKTAAPPRETAKPSPPTNQTGAESPAIASPPNGATAICADGTYSFSYSPDSCAGHGGIRQMLVTRPSSQNANRAVNTGRPSGPPPYDSRGNRLRAICNDGSFSYYQGSRAFVCLLKGGARVLYW